MVVADTQRIHVEVAYAANGRSCLYEMVLPAGTVVAEGYQQFLSSIDIDDSTLAWLVDAPLGIFGQRVKEPMIQKLQEGDRIEAYAPLKVDPKAARRARAAK